MANTDTDSKTVVFPVGVRPGTVYRTPSGDVTIGPARKTALTDKQLDYFHETHGASYFDHDEQRPTEQEEREAEFGDRKVEPPPRPGTLAYEAWAQEHELAGRAKVAIMAKASHEGVDVDPDHVDDVLEQRGIKKQFTEGAREASADSTRARRARVDGFGGQSDKPDGAQTDLPPGTSVK